MLGERAVRRVLSWVFREARRGIGHARSVGGRQLDGGGWV